MSNLKAKKILIVDDEKDIRSTIHEILSDHGHQTFLAATGVQARQLWRQHLPDIIYLDIWLPDTEGTLLLQELKQEGFLEHTPIIMMSGHGTLSKAIEAIQLGAYDFLEKPITLSKLLVTADRASQHQNFLLENNHLKNYAPLPPQPTSRSKFVAEQQETAERLAKFTMPILINGSKGTGKKSYAKTIHYSSNRKHKPLQIMSSADFSAQLNNWIGSANPENFKLGKIKNLQGGTLVLTDIENLSAPAQKVIADLIFKQGYKAQEAQEAYSLDLRIIATCSKDLAIQAEQDKFDAKLQERLQVTQLETPSLIQRADDLAELAQIFLKEFCNKHNLELKTLTQEAQEKLKSLAWPNNLLDLQSFIAQLALKAKSTEISLQELEKIYYNSSSDKTITTSDEILDFRLARDNFETDYFRNLLIKTQGNVSETAKISGLERTNLYRKLKSLNLDPKNPI